MNQLLSLMFSAFAVFTMMSLADSKSAEANCGANLCKCEEYGSNTDWVHLKVYKDGSWATVKNVSGKYEYGNSRKQLENNRAACREERRVNPVCQPACEQPQQRSKCKCEEYGSNTEWVHLKVYKDGSWATVKNVSGKYEYGNRKKQLQNNRAACREEARLNPICFQ